MTWVFIHLPGEFILTAAGLGHQLTASSMGIRAFHYFAKTNRDKKIWFRVFLNDFLEMFALKGVQTGSV